MKQVMNYHKDNRLLNMIRRTDPMIIVEFMSSLDTIRNTGAIIIKSFRSRKHIKHGKKQRVSIKNI